MKTTWRVRITSPWGTVREKAGFRNAESAWAWAQANTLHHAAVEVEAEGPMPSGIPWHLQNSRKNRATGILH